MYHFTNMVTAISNSLFKPNIFYILQKPIASVKILSFPVRGLMAMQYLARWNSRISSVTYASMAHLFHDDVSKWNYFPRYRPFVREIHRSPSNSPHEGVSSETRMPCSSFRSHYGLDIPNIYLNYPFTEGDIIHMNSLRAYYTKLSPWFLYP